MADTRVRETFGTEELACCLSHYDLGIVFSIKEFARGSRRAPKIIIECQKGRFLFKRRNKGVEEIKKVAFTHQIQMRLAEQSFPLPHLMGTREDNNSMLTLHDRIYEMQEYISGSIYDGTADATEQGGHALGLYHKLLMDFESDFEPVTASYHNAKAIHQSIQKTVGALKPQIERYPELRDTIVFLQNAYYSCAETVNNLGLRDWPCQIVHGDWHPGNMLFRDHLVVAVIDYDTARLQQRAIDLANGALQFSILGGGENPADWPEHLDMNRFGRFLMGYDSVNVITTDELRAIPYLMCEAMIAEAAVPIAQTGVFGRFDGGEFLTMIRRKVQWIFDNTSKLVEILSEESADDGQYAPAAEPIDPLEMTDEEEDDLEEVTGSSELGTAE